MDKKGANWLIFLFRAGEQYLSKNCTNIFMKPRKRPRAKELRPRAKGLAPKKKGYGTQRARQIGNYRKITAQIVEMLRTAPEHTAKSLARAGIPYDTANRILADLEKAGKYKSPFDRAKTRGPRSKKVVNRRNWLLDQFNARKTVEQIIAMKQNRFTNRRQVYKDIYALRLAGKKVEVPIKDPVAFEVGAIEVLIETNPTIRNAELRKRTGLKSTGVLRDRLRRADKTVLDKRVAMHTTSFSRAEIVEQNVIIKRRVLAGNKSAAIRVELMQMLGADLSLSQINQRITGSKSMRQATAGKRKSGRSRFTQEVVARQNKIIFGLVARGRTASQIVGKKGLEGLTRKGIQHRITNRNRSKKRK
ncbi:MAG: hypothetical protein CL943_01090 [Candidatus Diapherotrites archaeon]|uniref:Uncharacterized protein n=1 Tax=Candidatus Iainarchaeum sp. TaxID=3101447 RepID=A0A2D6M0C5_9ARCH|nr:hypothetical protein [Candidatus Diapherotrites archaeon]